MASKKPWRTLVIDESENCGRFTRKQIQEAVRAVKEESDRKTAAKAARARKAKPWRTVLVPEETGRFTREQIDAAIIKAKEERERKAATRAGKPPRQRKDEAKGGGRMTSKKPWRTLVFGSETGRFTREQVDAAVLAVMAESERKAARARKASGGVAPREGDAPEPVKAPAKQARKTPKAA